MPLMLNFNQIITNGNNLIDTNGDGVSDGITISNATSLSIVDNAQRYTPTAQFGQIFRLGSATANDKTYARVMVKSTSNSVYLNIGSSTGVTLGQYSGSGNFEWVSSVATKNGTGTCSVAPYSFLTSNWVPIDILYWEFFNLTAIFGSGNEPTKAEMDTILNSYFPNYWEGSIYKRMVSDNGYKILPYSIPKKIGSVNYN